MVQKYTKKNVAKVVLGGDGAVGKTTLSHRLIGCLALDKDRTMTPGIDVHLLKTQTDPSSQVLAQLIDLGGQEQFRFFQEDFCTGADIVIIAFAVDWFHSFLHVDTWLDLFENETPLKKFLVGTKIDSPDRAISREEARALAQKHSMVYYEFSAITGEGFDEFQVDLVTSIKQVVNQQNISQKRMCVSHCD